MADGISAREHMALALACCGYMYRCGLQGRVLAATEHQTLMWWHLLCWAQIKEEKSHG